MTPDEFDIAIAVADDIVQQCYRAFGPARREKLRKTLAGMVPPDSPHLMPCVQVFVRIGDKTLQKQIDLVRVDALITSDDERLFGCGFSVTPRTFLIEDRLVTVPDTQCPKCLSEWSVSLRDLKPCPECGLELIRDAKIVAVKNQCPMCEDEVDFDSTGVCGYCDFDLNADYAARVS